MIRAIWIPMMLAPMLSAPAAQAQMNTTFVVLPTGGNTPPAMLPPTVPAPMPAPQIPIAQFPISTPAPAPVMAPPTTLPSVPFAMEMVECSNDACERYCRVLGGVGVYFVKPFFENNPAISFFRQGTGPVTRNDIRHNIVAAPQAWIGVMNDDGLGVRGRYWYLRAGTDQTFQITAPSGPPLTVVSALPMGAGLIQNNPQEFAVTSKLELQVADIEVIQEMKFCNWNFLLAGGASRVDISQNYNAYATSASGVGLRPVFSDHRFIGYGPTIALEFRRPIADTCWNLYGSARSRLLYGNSKHLAYGGDQLNGLAKANQESLVSVQDLELGVEYACDFGHGRFFSQLAMVGQEWFGAGNPTRSSRASPPTTIPNFSSEDNSNFGFIGATVRMGVNY